MKLLDGGPAFPRPRSRTQSGIYRDQNSDVDEQDGMSLRDYFAGHGIAGLLSGNAHGPAAIDSSRRMYVSEAWQIADAMLAEREK